MTRPAFNCGTASLGLALPAYCLRQARPTLTIFKARWGRGAFAGDLGLFGFYLLARVGRAPHILLADKAIAEWQN